MHRALRALVRRVLSESQLEDTRIAERCWQGLRGLLSDTDAVGRALDAGPNPRVMQVAGGDIDPALEGSIVRLSPWTQEVLTSRFLDVGPEGERYTDAQGNPEMEIQLDFGGGSEYGEAGLAQDWDTVLAMAKKGNITMRQAHLRIAGAISGFLADPQRGRRLRSGLHHEVLHLLHAQRAGPEATHRGYLGPEHPTTQRRLASRIGGEWDRSGRQTLRRYMDTLTGPERAAASATARNRTHSMPLGDVDRSKKGSEGYASLDYDIQDAHDTLRDDPRIGHQEFMVRVLGRGKGAFESDVRRRRIARMVSKMWHDHRAGR